MHRVRTALHRSGRIRAITAGGVKYLRVCVDVECPYAFTYPEYAGRLAGVANVSETDLRHHLSKRRVVRYDCQHPSRVAYIRDKVLGYDNTFEADIPYVRRLFVDGQLQVDYDGRSAVFIDIEVDDSRGFPNPQASQIISVAYAYLGDDKVRWMYIGDYPSETAMLSELKKELEGNGVGLLVGWNVGFDAEFLRVRGGFDGFDTYDLLSAYREEVKGLENYSLDSVMRHEGMGSKHRDKRVCDMSRQELHDYNTRDVAVLVEIERKYGFVGLQLKIAELVNLPVGMLTPVRIGDTLILRRARELGYVLSNSVRAEKKSYPGAYVFEPRRKGLVRNVAVFDFESLYPSIIVNERIDIPGFNGEVLPHIISQLLGMRRKAKEMYKRTGDARYDVEQKAYKIIANALYGLFGTEGFRFLDIQKASMITSKGREMLLKASGIAEELGYSVIYGDTDSVFITGWADPGELVFIETAMNEMLKPYRVKLEYYGDIYLITKKKYILRLPDGKQVVKGVELVRGDWARIFKEVASSLVDMVFNGCTAQDIKAYLTRVRNELYSGRLDDKLVMCKGYNHSKEYKVASEHVKAARILARRYKVPPESITEVCYVYVKHGEGVEPVYEGRIPRGIDYDRYWERIMELAKRMLILNNTGFTKQ